MKKNLRAFLLSFLISILTLGLLAGILTADYRTGQTGFLTEEAFVAVSPRGEDALSVTLMGESFPIPLPAPEKLQGAYERWGWLLPAGIRTLLEGGTLLKEYCRGALSEETEPTAFYGCTAASRSRTI